MQHRRLTCSVYTGSVSAANENIPPAWSFSSIVIRVCTASGFSRCVAVGSTLVSRSVTSSSVSGSSSGKTSKRI